jgi:hypothetical protein
MTPLSETVTGVTSSATSFNKLDDVKSSLIDSNAEMPTRAKPKGTLRD